MSPTDAKRGAKRRKNKRGGGSSCSTVCNSSSGKAGVVSALCSQGTTTPVPAVPMNNSLTPQFTEGPVNADFSGVLQTPFTFGLNQRAPYTSGDRCLLCRCERKESVLQSETEGCGQNGSDQPTKNPSALQLPLWVCPDCRRTVEKEDRQTALEQSLGSQDFLLHMPVGNGGLVQEPAPADRLTTAAPALPMLPAPDLTTPMTADTVCSCEACNERREISAESERESQQLQNHWSEVRYLVRCIYRQTGTPLGEDHDQPMDRDKEGMKELVDRLCEKDPYQLYQRLEQQAREYVLEMKVRLLKHLSAGSKAGAAVVGSGAAAAAQGPPQAHQFVSLLLDEYNALCQAARSISSFLLTLENEHLQKFQVTWELHNKHLFENLVFSEPILHSSLPALVAQLKLCTHQLPDCAPCLGPVSAPRQGSSSHDSYSEDMYGALLESYQQLQQDMAAVAAKWQQCERRIDDYVDEQLLFKVEGQNLTNQRTEPHKSLISKNTLKTKQQMLKEDWEFFKQRRFIEEQLTNSKKSTPGDNFEDTMRMLSSRLSIPDCPNCNYRRRCTCDDCSLSHILTCGIMDSPMAEDLHIKLPIHGEPPRGYLAEVHPPSLSSGSSASGSNSSSPVTIQQHPRLMLPQGDTHNFISDDDEGPPMSTKFGDVYAMGAYEDHSVVTGAVNGLHADLNGGGESAELKGLSSSSSSSEGEEEEEEEADGGGAGEPPGRPMDHPSGTGNSPPPSYNHQLVEQAQHACQCHVCSQEPGSTSSSSSALHSSRLQTPAPPPAFGQQFFTDTKAPSAHPALHLYPHIHGHLPLHNLSHLPRPLLHPTLYPPSSPLTHNKPLPPAPSSNHSAAKQPAFSPSLPDHVYQNCFGAAGGGTGDWNSSLQCLSLKFENLWDAAVMKSLNTSMLLPESLPSDMLRPPLPDVPLPQPTYIGAHRDGLSLAAPLPPPSCSSSSSSSSCSTSSMMEAMEQKKSGAKKKCLYNFQDAFLESHRVAMATSGATASVSCTATTVQSSNNPTLHLSSKRPNSLDDVFHSLGKEDHRLPSPVAPRNSPTGLASLPLLSGPSLPTAPNAHLPAMGSQPFPRMPTPAPGFLEAHHQGLCLSPAEPPAPSIDGPVSAPPSVCSDPDCEGHRCEGNGAYEHQPYDGEESQDEDSCSEHSSSTSTSTNQKEGKYCDCCYCEFFGHGGPPAAPTSRNYAEMREKLRLRLTKRKEEQPKREEQQPVVERDGGVEDHRRVEDLLQFINSADSKPTSSSKAAKRARHKQKKLEEKARQEVEAREREEQLLEDERRRRQQQDEEEAELQRELLRLQELQHLRAAKKKRRERAKENTAPPQNSPQPLRQAAQNVLENLHNGKSQLLHGLIRLPGHKEATPPPPPPPQPQLHKQHIPKSPREKATPPAPGSLPSLPASPLLNGTAPASHPELRGKAQVRSASRTACCEAAVRKAPEKPRGCDAAGPLTNGTAPATSAAAPHTKATQPRAAAEALTPLPAAAQPGREDPQQLHHQHHHLLHHHHRVGSGKRQHQSHAPPAPPPPPPPPPPHQPHYPQVREERRSPPVLNHRHHSSSSSSSPPLPPPPPAGQSEHPQQNGKPPKAESPQPKGKAKKNKKKKGDKMNSSIDDVFLPKDIDLDSTEMDETEREVEYFKRFCLDSARQTRQRLSINWSNFSLKKATFAAH
ncbi:protein FAM193A isoform X4 [Gadus macrocephalus]|uniref:protein FAM193A isoform X4 n=1 Tax=Gadus macrocephalus TaxID=80720 RepID=UPI0028CB4F5D|nr:protein FAM193A isoform X4 [Gadus macrocephalus]